MVRSRAGPLDRGLGQVDLVVALGHPAGLEHLADVVELLALEEDHRVGADERGVHHALGVIRGDRVDDFQARDVGTER